MKLPAKDDPHGDYAGRVPRDIVISTLKDNAVSVLDLGEDLFLLSKADELEAQVLRSYVGGLMVKHLAEKFGINPLEFYFDFVTNQRKFHLNH